MFKKKSPAWKQKTVSTDEVLKKIEPGMHIFIGTGTAEPRTLVKALMTAQGHRLEDLTLIQLLSFGDAISFEALESHRYRLRTFFSGWVSARAITQGRADMIPSRFSAIPFLLKEGQIPVDVAFVQITPPNESGYCSLGVGVDVARRAMALAGLVVGEINEEIPFTLGDTFVHMDAFDMIVEAKDPPFYYPRYPVAPIFDRLAENISSIIDNGSCLAFTFGPVFEALPKYLSRKRDLGIHTPFFTDALMELVKSGAVTNREKGMFRGRSLTSYALGSKELMRWLDKNPMVEFQTVEKVFSPMEIGRNKRFVMILPVRRLDLSGRVALHRQSVSVAAGPGQIADFLNGAEISRGGYTMVVLPSRNRDGHPNVRLSLADSPELLSLPESVDMVVTEQGVAHLRGRTLRERAQALIEIAHPEDRADLVEGGKKANLLYKDQIFLAGSANLYPSDIATQQSFKNDLLVHFRAIRPSDEDQMRRLFYRFSDKAIYYRYFSPIKTMPHAKMQAYVNVDYKDVLSVVGLVGEPEHRTIIAEARIAKYPDKPFVDIAFVVDEAYQGRGIASFLYQMLARLAKERGCMTMTADVLTSNRAMLKVFEGGGYPVTAKLEGGAYALKIDLTRTVE
ncbi:bifunctional acetyl-CoA hydrolase/transferase family protein/GNAT family N-acetyltransferase [Desulfospira joergensenii]|uniref:bifunctional acetyl-CoA hydrolase/transferase family protein/GNAT family N-acetyltransferase n=1 Tax=Desulfospira joergensenii TaxID=53329 RepID=UPI0003B4525B|nr:bifunctional acetyl-CoA hydrolase/transferase family protein/GNAT family N-acetyltransferase [Desulfospira joergensenii]